MYVLCDLAVLTSAWMGYSTFEEEIANERISLIGNELISRTLSKWLKRSRFADMRYEAVSKSSTVRYETE